MKRKLFKVLYKVLVVIGDASNKFSDALYKIRIYLLDEIIASFDK